MAKIKDFSYMIGLRYGKLVVTGVERREVKDGLRVFCICNCDCGNTGVFIRRTNLIKGTSRSCGCTKRKTKERIIQDHSYIIGQKFGHLTVAGIEAGRDAEGFMTPLCVCKCDCGNENVVLRKGSLTTGHTKSCGCSRKYHVPWGKSYHGHSGERLYGIWSGMLGRCLNPNNGSFFRYGGRGITICDEWLGDEGFLNFLNWAKKNGYADNLTIDRIDNDDGYYPGNCRWTDRKTQSYNHRVRCDSVSGVCGVRKRKTCEKWTASVVANGKSFYVGDFDSLEEAARARNGYIRDNGLPNKPSCIPGTRLEY